MTWAMPMTPAPGKTWRVSSSQATRPAGQIIRATQGRGA